MKREGYKLHVTSWRWQTPRKASSTRSRTLLTPEETVKTVVETSARLDTPLKQGVNESELSRRISRHLAIASPAWPFRLGMNASARSSICNLRPAICKRSGFTLMELLVVCLLIAVMAALIVP